MEFPLSQLKKCVFEDVSAVREKIFLREGLVEMDGKSVNILSMFSSNLESTAARTVGYKRQRLLQEEKEIDWNIKLYVKLYSNIGADTTGKVHVVQPNSESSGLKHLADLFGDLNLIKLNIDLHLVAGNTRFRIVRKSTPITNYVLKKEDRIGSLVEFTFPESLKRFWRKDWLSVSFSENERKNIIVEAELKVSILISSSAISALYVNQVADTMSINKTLLTDSLTADGIIVANNGARIPCHTAFLAAHSPVFRAMLLSPMKEGNTKVVEVSDMNEPAVRAMLAYLYCWEIQDALESCTITRDLLQAADKYDMSKLEEAMTNIILAKDNDWFSVKTAFLLWHDAVIKKDVNSNGNHNRIATKAAAVLKSKPADEIKKEELFKKWMQDPKMAELLCIHFICH